MSPSARPAAAPTPLSSDQAGLLETLTSRLDHAGLWWVSGYAAGLARARMPASTGGALALPAASDTAAGSRASIVYGSQTGNARRVAEQLAAEFESSGLPVRLLRADAYPLRELKTERLLYLVISTQGDGDPPDDARDLHAHLTGPRAQRLEHLQYAVLGLGDSSYPKFCAIGETLHARLAELGARPLFASAQADLDIDTVAAPWRAEALARAKELLKPSATVTPLRPSAPSPASNAPSREAPFSAELLANQRITASAGSKDVRHVELSLDEAGITYEPGDALGVWPRNPAALVAEVIDTLALDGDTEVTQAGTTLPLHQWLGERRELTRLSRPFVAAHAERSDAAALQQLLAPEQAPALQALLAKTQVIDLLQQHRGEWQAEALVAALRPLTPRLYSIASSRKEVGDEVHLTVAHVEYTAPGGLRWGAASHTLASATAGDRLPVYVEPNDRFRLPEDPSRDVIMIGPGTGVAPFRAFLQERRALRAMSTGSSGRHWLFFGNPHFHSDFLYQLEWQRALKDGTLDRIDLAFSRDAPSISGNGAARIYVQQRIAERARDLHDWLQAGASLYVCGAIAMGKDVHAALRDAIASQNGGDHEAATETMDQLAREGRYARDVY